MALKMTKALFVLSCVAMGAIWTSFMLEYIFVVPGVPMARSTTVLWYAFGGAAGGAVSFIILFGLRFVTQELFERLFPVVIAISLSMMTGYLLAQYIKLIWPLEPGNVGDINRHVYTMSTCVLLFGFIGISLGLTKASSWEALVTVVKRQKLEYGNPKMVDTSVIIDGRIQDIVEAGFIEGTLIVPRFILRELQHVADSADVLRRTKGRRGLDILKAMQEDQGKVDVEIIDDDPEEIREVDGKLVVLARKYSAQILTTDYNLNKVAQIEGIRVLNVNDLANALKPAALPDENLTVKIVKEGKEADQGVGYLDDGTMIVVDGGRNYVGRRVSAVVTSVLQTAAGRMIFTKLGQVLPEESREAAS